MSDTDAAIRAALSAIGEVHEPGGVWTSDRAIWAASRLAALEEAAKVCEKDAESTNDGLLQAICRSLARAIRALKEKQ